MSWLYEIRDENGENPVRVLNARNRTVATALNAPAQGQASFTIDLDDPVATEQNLRESRSQLFIYRNNVLYWSGIIMIVERSFDTSAQYATVTAFGWTWAFSKRYCTLTEDFVITNEDATSAFMAVFSLGQTYDAYCDLGITVDSYELTGTIIDVVYKRQRIADILSDLSSQFNIDWEVTPQKKLRVYNPKGIDKSATIKFKYPGNIINCRVVNDATTIINDAYLLGTGTGDQELTSEVVDNGSKSVFGTYLEILSYKDIQNQELLDGQADYILKLNRSSRITLDLEIDGDDTTIDLFDYNLGDSVQVNIQTTNFTFKNAFRVFERRIAIDETEKERINLVVAMV